MSLASEIQARPKAVPVETAARVTVGFPGEPDPNLRMAMSRAITARERSLEQILCFLKASESKKNWTADRFGVDLIAVLSYGCITAKDGILSSLA